MSTFYVTKNAHTMRRLFMMYGLAELLYQLSSDTVQSSIQIKDMGSVYQLDIDTDVESLVNNAANLPALLPAIVKPTSPSEIKKIKTTGSLYSVIDRHIPKNYSQPIIVYVSQFDERNKENNKHYPIHRGVWDDPMFPIWNHLYSFSRGAVFTKLYPTLIHLWHAHAKVTATGKKLISDLLNNVSQPYNQIDAMSSIWANETRPMLNYETELEQFKLTSKQACVSGLQILSPSTVQGLGTADYRKRFKSQNPAVFWLEMYLSIAGFIRMAIIPKSQDNVIIVTPMPIKNQYHQLRDITIQCRYDYSYHKIYNNDAYSSEQMITLTYLPHVSESDTLFHLAVFEYIKVTNHLPSGSHYLLLHSIFHNLHKQLNRQFSLLIRTIVELIDSLKMPQEMRKNKQQKQKHNYIVEKIISYLALPSLRNWLIFFTKYVVNMVKSDDFVEPTSDILRTVLSIQEELYMIKNNEAQPSIARIFEDDGFKSVAKAINSCTRYAIYKRSADTSYPYKIKYDLARKLRNSTHSKAEFVETLFEFISSYQIETSTIKSKTGTGRYEVSYMDLHSVSALIDLHGTKIMAEALIAAGFTKQVFEQTDTSEEQEAMLGEDNA